MLTFVVQGLLIGAIYGLIALSLTIIFGILKIINFSHGQFFMLSMYIAYFITVSLGVKPYVAAIFGAVIMFMLGYIIQKSLIQTVLNYEANVREPIGALVLTAGLGIVMENTMMVTFGSNYKSLPNVSQASLQFGSIIISIPKLYAFLIAIATTLVLYLFLQKTEIGRTIRAVGQDRNTSYLMGINVERTFAICYAICCASLGIAGAAVLPFYYVHPTVGMTFGNVAFITVILGGLGSIPGAIIGGLLIGVLQSVSAMFVPSTLSLTVVYYLFLIFVFIRPQGLMGSRHDW